jgi:hypothetical protein
VVERFEVPDQGAGVGGLAEPFAEGGGVGGWKGVANGFRKLDDGCGAETPVQVVVKGYLGEALQVEVKGRGGVNDWLSHVPTLGLDRVQRQRPAAGRFSAPARLPQ